jgi:hypothetical protein
LQAHVHPHVENQRGSRPAGPAGSKREATP